MIGKVQEKQNLEEKTFVVHVKEDSIFDPDNKRTIISLNGTKLTINPSLTPSFLKDFYELLNPIQATFYLALQRKFRNTPFSAICVTPTSSGKTGIILIYLNHMLEIYHQQKSGPVVVYVSPLKALAREKFEEFVKVFGKDNVEMKTGDTPDSKLKGKKILVSTPDYLSLAIRNEAYFTKNIKAVIVDEVHTVFVNFQNVIDEILWFIKEENKHFLLLSATVPLVEKSIAFFKPNLFLESAWRPVKLETNYKSSPSMKNFIQEGFKFCKFKTETCENICPLLNHGGKLNVNSTQYFVLSSLKLIADIYSKENLDRAKTLFFVHSKKEGWSLLEYLNKYCGFSVLNEDESVPFEIEQQGKERPLYTAFYCADLSPKERVKIEKEFHKNKDFPILISTSSLAYGVNLPADIVVVPVEIRKPTCRYGEPILFYPDLIDCIQMAGRAGRFGLSQSQKGTVYFFFKNSFSKMQEAIGFIEDFKNFPYEEILNLHADASSIANLILVTIKRNKNVSDIPKYSFYTYCGEIPEARIIHVRDRLFSYNYITFDAETRKNILSEKGNYCLASGINPFTLEKFLRIIPEIENRVKDSYLKSTLIFLESIVLSGISAISTIKLFSSKMLGSELPNKEIVDRMTEFVESESFYMKIPRGNLVKRLITEQKDIFRSPIFDSSRDLRLLSLRERLQIIEEQTIFSFFLLLSGIYFCFGLPRPYSDLSYITPSTINYYIRNLLSFQQYFSTLSPAFIFYTSHIFNHQLLGDALALFLAMKTYFKEKLRFGYFKKNLLSLIFQYEMKNILKYPNDFLSLKDKLINIVEYVALNRKELYEFVKQYLEVHLEHRKAYFKKNIDTEKIKSEFLDFKEKLDTFISEVLKNNFLNQIEDHDIYSTEICEFIARNLGEKFSSTEETKKYISSYFKLRNLAVSNVVI
ncbi:MAG: DEAD/DEAH box helicase [Caldisericum sp.]